ncbi:hypothetical protein, partial [Propionibacterium freudenreichii]|uniref:hypothetical protein n=1 Tax=Propionibacterium freudenreichii TaxID=1744 RepID=UPI003857DD55
MQSELDRSTKERDTEKANNTRLTKITKLTELLSKANVHKDQVSDQAEFLSSRISIDDKGNLV